MHRSWRYFLIGQLWCLPITLGYLLFVLVFYRAWHFRFHDGVLTCIAGSFDRISKHGGWETVTRIWGRPAAQTVGTLCVFANEEERARGDLRVHEFTHIAETYLCGFAAFAVVPPIFVSLGWSPWIVGLSAGTIGVLVYCLAYLVIFLGFYFTRQKDEKEGWDDDYRRNWLERWAFENEFEYREMRAWERERIWGHR